MLVTNMKYFKGYILIVVLLAIMVLILNAGADVTLLGSDGNPGTGVNTSLANNITENVTISQGDEFLNFTLNDTAENLTWVNITFPSNFTLPANDTANYTLTGFIGLDGTNVSVGVSGHSINVSNSTDAEIWNTTAGSPSHFSINITNDLSFTGTSGTFQINVTTNQTPGGKLVYLTVAGAPIVTVNTPTDAQKKWVCNGTLLDLNATITDIGSGVNPEAVTVNLNGVNTTITTAILGQAGDYWTNNTIIVSAINNYYALDINASDNASQWNNTTHFAVWVDNVLPTVFLPVSPSMPTGATDYANFTNTSAIPVNVSVNDTWGNISTVWCKVTNESGGHVLNYTLANTSISAEQGYYYNGTIPGDFTILPPGAYNITIYANDSAGNENNSVPSQFVLNAANISQIEDCINSGASGAFVVNFTYPNDTELPVDVDFVPNNNQMYKLKINVSDTYMTIVNFSAAEFGKAMTVDANNTGINITAMTDIGLNATEKVWLTIGEFIPEEYYEYGIIRFSGTGHERIYYINGTMAVPQWNNVTDSCNKSEIEDGTDNVTNHGGYCYNESDGYTYLYVEHFSGGAVADDTVPPEVTAISPIDQWVNNGTLLTGSLLQLNASITDIGSGVENASVNVSGINDTITTATLTNSTGDYWTNGTIIVMALEGTHNLTITAYDKNTTANVNNTVNLTVKVDNTKPLVSAANTVYPDGQTAANNGSVIVLNATITDGSLSGVKNATVTTNVTNISSSLTSIILTNTPGTTYWVNDSITINGTDGTYLLNVTTYDNATNVNDTVQFTVILDNTKPTIHNVTLNETTGIAAGASLLVSVNASDDNNINKVTVIDGLNGSVVNLTHQAGLLWNGTIRAASLNGTYNVTVTAYDAAARNEINNTVQYTVTSNDSEAPTINSITLNTSTPEYNDPVLVSVNVTDDLEVRNVSANGVLLTQQANPDIWNGTITAEWALILHNVTVIAYDYAHNDTTNDTVQYTTNDASKPIMNNDDAVTSSSAYDSSSDNFTNWDGTVTFTASVKEPHLDWSDIYVVAANGQEVVNKIKYETGDQTNGTNISAGESYSYTWGAEWYNITNGTTSSHTTLYINSSDEYFLVGNFSADGTTNYTNVTAYFKGSPRNLYRIVNYSDAVDITGNITNGTSTFTPQICINDAWQDDSVTFVINITDTTPYLQVSDAPDGVYTIYLYAEDVSDNSNDSTGKKVTVDNVDPTIADLSLSTTSPSYNQAVTVSVNASDENNVSKVTAAGVTLVEQSGTLWNGTITAGYSTNTVTVIVYDAAGNSKTNISLSYTGPSATISSKNGGRSNWYYYQNETATPTPTSTPTGTAEATAISDGTEPGATPTSKETPTPDKTKGIPGFEAVMLTAGLLTVAYIIMRKRG